MFCPHDEVSSSPVPNAHRPRASRTADYLLHNGWKPRGFSSPSSASELQGAARGPTDVCAAKYSASQ